MHFDEMHFNEMTDDWVPGNWVHIDEMPQRCILTRCPNVNEMPSAMSLDDMPPIDSRCLSTAALDRSLSQPRNRCTPLVAYSASSHRSGEAIVNLAADRSA